MKSDKKEKETDKKIEIEDPESLETKYEDKETIKAISRYIG